MLGIIGAMTEEVANLKEQMENVEIQTAAKMDFYKGKLKGKDVVVVRSGIGKVNAAVCSQILADRYHVDGIINTGIAGSLRNEINIGDIVLSEDTLQHDMDATGFGHPIGEIPQMDVSVFKGDPHMLQVALQCCRQEIPEIGVHTGRIVSGDQFVSTKEKKKWLLENFQGFCTEMEGAAIAQTAYLNQIPFLIIRAISDKADDSATMDYTEFEAKAIEHSVKLVMAMVEKL
jgi:adenosylhomocysteine nucleosidase